VIQPDFNRAKITSDFGFLLLREIDELFKIIDPKKDCLADLRSPTHTNDHFLTTTTKDEKWLVLVGLAVPGRLSLAGTEARPNELFS